MHDAESSKGKGGQCTREMCGVRVHGSAVIEEGEQNGLAHRLEPGWAEICQQRCTSLPVGFVTECPILGKRLES